MVTGNQGNFFTCAWTSNEDLQQGAFNTLRNKAATMGGNYVQMLANQDGSTGSGSAYGFSQSQTNYASTGNVYCCPN